MSFQSEVWPVFLRWLAHELRPYWPPKRPGSLSVHLVREDKDTGMLVYKLTLPPPGAPDVVRRVLKETVNGGEPVEKDASDGMELKYNDNDVVALSLVDWDDANNASQPSPTLTFTATDTFAPAAPGTLGVELLREE